MARAAAAQLAAKLAALDDAAASSSKAGGGRARRGAGAPRDGAAAAARAPGLRAARGPETSLTVEATKAAVGAFFRQCATPKGRCENCGAYNPTLRRRARPRLAWWESLRGLQQARARHRCALRLGPCRARTCHAA